MKFYRVYIELTNICGLKCSFCPPKTLPTHTMSLAFFEHILTELKPYTKEIAYHIVGDPLTLSHLKKYLDKSYDYGFKVMLTTSGYYLNNHSLETLLHPAIKQINISLNSFNKNTMPLSFDAYMDAVVNLCDAKIARNKELFINLRLWNIDEAHSEEAFNTQLFAYLETHFKCTLHVNTLYEKNMRSIRLAEKIRLHFDDYFEWPSLSSDHASQGRCLGLSSHFGILANGSVVPCCLDKDACISLGNLQEHSLHSILNAPRTRAIIEGFKEDKAVEILCQKCTYKNRFKEQ
ncbi:radical SAM/SPASM domain-containing protein [Sulfurospirillum barnesii]|uniref:Putative Fe-S oxidoreductase n=1 Tax=Sulfurospirillum barnesii (strain ATCC 700032 / DSM 10660 / SES-3) TaxID=760154 RepID=I3XYM5_SULBS|nr:radical SAM/SPASM domain-containing protein [Sulfurospirillum barnesii]AFL69049.1 putative Fe-S oxidoreductase [Sulfurospirillum barnesii SES-3]